MRGAAFRCLGPRGFFGRTGHVVRGSRTRQRGLATVEFALLLPVLLGLLMGMIEFGLALHDKSVLTQACREGARAGIVLRETKLNEAAIKAIVDERATQLVSLLPTEKVRVTVQQLSPSADMNTLRVSAAYTFRGLLWGGLLQGLGMPLVISAAVEMVHE